MCVGLESKGKDTHPVRFDGFVVVHIAFETLHAQTLDHVSIRDCGTAAGRWGLCCSIHVAGFRQLMVD